MPKTQRLIVACLVLLTGVGIGLLFAALFTFEVAEAPPAPVVVSSTHQKQNAVYAALKQRVSESQPEADGLSPYMLLEQFPGVVEEDFDDVEAVIGRYGMVDGVLTYQSGERVADAAASDLSEAGCVQFIKNYSTRTGIDIATVSAEEFVTKLAEPFQGESSSDAATTTDAYTACTMDAKVCPDGSYVGRVGPNCEFAACPTDTVPQAIVCTPEQKQAEACIEIYQPVCASVQIQCVTTPCEPIQKTFSNSCDACSQHSVTEYTEGACATE